MFLIIVCYAQQVKNVNTVKYYEIIKIKLITIILNNI